MKKMEKIKAKAKMIWNDYGYQIGIGVGTVVLLTAGGLWIRHVKRNTVELEKLSIPNGECFQHYRQFGKTYMNAEGDLGSIPTFVQGLLDSGLFKASDKMIFMLTDDKDILK